MIGIYKITNLITNKVYIGQSVDIERRWKQHIESSKNPTNSSYYNQLSTDFRYYGIHNFSFEVLETIDKKVCSPGSTAYIISSGDVYMLNNKKEWVLQ